MKTVFCIRLVGVALLLSMFASGTTPAQTVYKRLEAPVLPSQPYDYDTGNLPPHVSTLFELDSTPSDNPVTNAGATLGRVLFYDRQLSANGLVACASCHSQAFGFDDHNRFSIGYQGRITRRAAMTLANARFNPRGHYFHDERAETLEAQVLTPLTDPIEMGLVLGEAVDRVQSRAWYGDLFSAAFGDSSVSEKRISRALAQFVRSIVSFRSRYDIERSKAGSARVPFSGFTDSENRGKDLFFRTRSEGGAGCASCHETEGFVMLDPRDNGLDDDGTMSDKGISEITGESSHEGLFRAASLKNVAKSAPYMHDGRFSTLSEVVDHYSKGIKSNRNLAPQLRNDDGTPVRFEFSEADKKALIAFLTTLTDEPMMTDEKFSDPFLQPTGQMRLR